ncbi:hypothetical protein EP30_10135 [Bifidobacterium sp. UTCIF-39]|nr:hypothetical protein EP30_10135 [Bifidobacterium sp. UTCIF-39]
MGSYTIYDGIRKNYQWPRRMWSHRDTVSDATTVIKALRDELGVIILAGQQGTELSRNLTEDSLFLDFHDLTQRSSWKLSGHDGSALPTTLDACLLLYGLLAVLRAEREHRRYTPIDSLGFTLAQGRLFSGDDVDDLDEWCGRIFDGVDRESHGALGWFVDRLKHESSAMLPAKPSASYGPDGSYDDIVPDMLVSVTAAMLSPESSPMNGHGDGMISENDQ